MTHKSTLLLALACTTLVRALGAGELATLAGHDRQSPQLHRTGAQSLADPDFGAAGIARDYHALDWSVSLSLRLTLDSLLWTNGGAGFGGTVQWLARADLDPRDPPLNYSISPYDVFRDSTESATVHWTAVACIDRSRTEHAVDELDAKLTPLSGERAAVALRRAWKRAKRQNPSLDLLTILTAHWAHETGEGRTMYNYNFGGVKGRAPDGHSCVRPAREGHGSRSRHGLDRFRAYSSSASGADDYLSLLLRRYASAVSAAEHGEVDGFVTALRDGGYFTGNALEYARAIARQSPIARAWAISALASSGPAYLPSVVATTDSAVLTPGFVEALPKPP